MPPRKPRAVVSGSAPEAVARPVTDPGRVVACPGCGSVACAVTGLAWCRHTGQPRDPDPTAVARLEATRLPIRTSSRSVA